MCISIAPAQPPPMYACEMKRKRLRPRDKADVVRIESNLVFQTDKVMYISYADIGGMTRDAMEACDNHFGQTNGEMKDQDGKGYIVIVSHTDKC